MFNFVKIWLVLELCFFEHTILMFFTNLKHLQKFESRHLTLDVTLKFGNLLKDSILCLNVQKSLKDISQNFPVLGNFGN